jgi:flavorubredoxin
MDHSGSLPKVIEIIKPNKIFASKMGVQALKENLHLDTEITAVENHGQLTLGDSTFTFIETRMLHWPDSMFTYFENDKILFSQDGLSMHLATDLLFADQNDQGILLHEATKYYANILLPYSAMVSKLIKALPFLNLDIKMIAPDHGPIWRTPKDIAWIIDLWKVWSEQKSYQKVVIVYDTMWQSTAKMAAAIADGVMAENVDAKVLPLSSHHRSDIAMELLEAGALIVGSPTLNQSIFPTVADCLCYLKGLNRTNLIGQVFSSYGWADKAGPELLGYFEKMKIKLVGEPVTSKYVPTNDILEKCRQLGQEIAKLLKKV